MSGSFRSHLLSNYLFVKYEYNLYLTNLSVCLSVSNLKLRVLQTFLITDVDDEEVKAEFG